MTEARCMKCKVNVQVKDPKDTVLERKNKEGKIVARMAAVKGVCPKCGTKVFRITGKAK